MKAPIIILSVLSVMAFQCSEKVMDGADAGYELTITKDEAAYNSIYSALETGSGSDLFTINKVTINDATLTMQIEVSYGGGCEKHSFELVWPDAIIAIYPPQFSVILEHSSNGDLCEAWLTQTLEIDLQNNPLAMDAQSVKDMTVTVINASNPEEKVQSE